MTDILKAYELNRLWDFKGGIHPPEMKSQSNQQPIKKFPLVKNYFIPLVQHAGSAGELLVKPGEQVLKGQALTRGDGLRALPVHAPTSGKIVDISPHTANHPSGLTETCIHLEADSKDQWRVRELIDWENLSTIPTQKLIDRIYNAGIAGLGGAVFPTAAKIDSAQDKIKLLIINGAECEPYITCDDRLMQDYSKEILQGVTVAQKISTPEKTVIAVEDNKPQAIQVLKETIETHGFNVDLRVIPTKYPSGDAKQLTYILTGIEVPKGKRSSSIGALTLNVGTCYAIKRAVFDDEPLIERVVTLTGNRIPEPQNYWIPLGTPIKDVLDSVNYQHNNNYPIIVGGPLMGFMLQDLSAPVTKVSNCFIAPDNKEYDPHSLERSCIRCSACSEACPVSLLPQELYWFARSDNHDKSKDYHLKDCIECGICAYVCPSQIPLVQYFRQEKTKIWQEEEKIRKAEEAKARFEARLAREEKAKAERKARMETLAQMQRQKAQEAEGKDPVAEALARIKAKQNSPSIQRVHIPESDEHRSIMAARRARRLANEEKSSAPLIERTLPISENLDPKKAAVAAAIARAKAKKDAQQKASAQIIEKSLPVSENLDPKKSAVAAAIARAKAKKDAQQKASAPIIEKTLPVSENLDPKKAAVAAAIARAKAKRQLQQEEQKNV